jgi:hypothetical protein
LELATGSESLIAVVILRVTLGVVPPPGTYELASSFEGENQTIKASGITSNFRLQSSREAYGKVYMPGGRRSPKGFEDQPGPDTYTCLNYAIGRNAVKYTLKSRTKVVSDPYYQAEKQSSQPGPGQYETIGISSDGSYLVSTIP